MIDTHSHLDSTHFDNDRELVIEQAFQSGIEYIIIPAVEHDGFEKLQQVVAMDSRLYCAIGIHPHSANSVDDFLLKQISNIADEKKVIAIGEIGLDYYYDFAAPETQKDAFRAQIKIAKEKNLPIIVHNRESDDDLMDILHSEQDGNLRGVLHCFSSSEEYMKKAIDLGFHVSFTGNITFKKSNLSEVVKSAPINKIMLETDAPYMTPVPHRGTRNTPDKVKLVAEKIAEIKNISLNEVISMTTANAKKLFGLLSIVLFMLIPIISYSQDQEDIYLDEEEEYYENPYKKVFGFGLTLGTNTVVESYEPVRYSKSASLPVLFSYGGVVQYGPLDFLTFSASYIYSKDTRNVEIHKVEPTTYQQFELTSHWIANPHGRVNFYGMIGASMLINSYGKSIGQGQETFTRSAINGGIGFFINIPIESMGMFVLAGEWKLNYQLGVVESAWDPSNPYLDPTRNEPTEISTFFSIPKLNIMWYPTFLFK